MNHFPTHAGPPAHRWPSGTLLAVMLILLGFTAGLFGLFSHKAGWNLKSAAVLAMAQGQSLSPPRVLRVDLPAAAPMRHVGLPGPPFRGPDLLEGTSEQSTNWAGYDAIGGDFTSVTASWVQPAIAPSSAETYAAFWAGLDGDGSSTVEQTGTLAYSENGEVSYEAWYEMYPAALQTVSLSINPGDSLTATVTSESGGQFDLTLTDHTTGKTANETETSTTAQDYSAEVIAEAPSSETSVLPLADFGTVGFTDCAFNDLPISAFAWNQIDMVSSGGSAEATTSALGGDGSSFSVSTAPTISGFSPTSGQVRSSVTLAGSGFSPATAVSFNGTAAAFTVNSDAQITATVPAGASSGPITVTTPAGSAASSASFTVTALSGDDTLASLTVSAGSLSPAFAATTLSYADSVANSVTGISITATPTDGDASYQLEVGGAPVTNPIALSVGANLIDVVVSAQDGAQQTYGLTVTRAAALSPTPTLSLRLNGLVRGALKLGKRVTARGTVIPSSLAGSKVTLTVQRRHDGRWRKVTSSARTINSVGSAYSWVYKPARRGVYRVRAVIAKTGAYAAAATTWRRFKVK
jgi:hypothetical protein